MRISTIVGLAAALLPTLGRALHIHVTNNKTVEIPKTLYGWMWEDINHSTDGGLYAELLQNRAFQAVTPGTSTALDAWGSYGGANISVTASTPGVSAALPNSLAVVLGSHAAGGFYNKGYWGIKIDKTWTYKVSFYAKSTTYRGKLKVTLKSTSGTVFASHTVSGVTNHWKKFSFKFQPTRSAPSTDNVFDIALESTAAGTTIHFGLFSLFPPTWKNRENGQRIDLAEAMAAIKPGVWRFPGGNNLEGITWDQRWKWNETIGPLENRPGRFGDWTYPNTDGMGLMEYLQWAEDIGAETILGVWAGVSIGNWGDIPGSTVVPEDQLQPYVDDVLNEIEFIVGDASTSPWAALRAKYGRKEPYSLTFIEVGNEDFFHADTYQAYRWAAFVNAIEAKYPGRFKMISTAYPETPLNPPAKYIDPHQYNTPEWFLERSTMFDSSPRDGPKYFMGEYAVISTNSSCLFCTPAEGRLAFPSLQGALAEAAFMTGMERNSDVVFASAYAPTLQNLDSYQWTPDIISFDADSIIKSPSYYAQLLFGANLGTHVLSSTPASTASLAPIYYVASIDSSKKVIYVKIVNNGAQPVSTDFSFDYTLGQRVTVSTLKSSNLTIENTPLTPTAVVPTESSFSISQSKRFNYTLPGYSISVLKVSVRV